MSATPTYTQLCARCVGVNRLNHLSPSNRLYHSNCSFGPVHQALHQSACLDPRMWPQSQHLVDRSDPIVSTGWCDLQSLHYRIVALPHLALLLSLWNLYLVSRLQWR